MHPSPCSLPSPTPGLASVVLPSVRAVKGRTRGCEACPLTRLAAADAVLTQGDTGGASTGGHRPGRKQGPRSSTAFVQLSCEPGQAAAALRLTPPVFTALVTWRAPPAYVGVRSGVRARPRPVLCPTPKGRGLDCVGCLLWPSALNRGPHSCQHLEHSPGTVPLLFAAEGKPSVSAQRGQVERARCHLDRVRFEG